MQRNESSTPTSEDSAEVVDERRDLLASIANTIKDYRADDPTIELPPNHVELWAGQFADEVQIPLLREIDHILKKTYMTKDTCVAFLEELAMRPPNPTDDPGSFWKKVKFLRLQKTGNSQNEMMDMFDAILSKHYGFKTSECGNDDSDEFVYLDDGIFTGNRVKHDLIRWVENEAPNQATVYIVTIVSHTLAEWYISICKGGVNETAMKANKIIALLFRPVHLFEDQKSCTNTSDVLRPTSVPADDENIAAYMASGCYYGALRVAGESVYLENSHPWQLITIRPGCGRKEIFASEDGRNLVEQTFLKLGAEIWRQGLLPPTYRPLGNSYLGTLGFGSMVVTYRNCPNTAPLALWACKYPLFPRKEQITPNSELLSNEVQL